MKKAYPIILTTQADCITVFIPDFDANTQGEDMPNAIEMARDVIGLMGIDMEDDLKPLPLSTPINKIYLKNNEILSLVDVNFTDYRRKNELRTVKKNCTIPSWLSYEAEKANLNFSAVLQNALKEELHLNGRL